MSFCSQCGKQVPDGTKFCPYCGAVVPTQEAAPQEQPQVNIPNAQELKDSVNTENVQGQFTDYFKFGGTNPTVEEQQDAAVVKNKIMAILAYASAAILTLSFAANYYWLSLIWVFLMAGVIVVPIIIGKDSPFVKFHLNNGIILLVLAFTVTLLSIINHTIFPLRLNTTTWSYGRVFLYYIFQVLYWLVNIGVLALTVFGIIHAAKGEKKALPIVGGLKIFK